MRSNSTSFCMQFHSFHVSRLPNVNRSAPLPSDVSRFHIHTLSLPFGWTVQLPACQVCGARSIFLWPQHGRAPRILHPDTDDQPVDGAAGPDATAGHGSVGQCAEPHGAIAGACGFLGRFARARQHVIDTIGTTQPVYPFPRLTTYLTDGSRRGNKGMQHKWRSLAI